PFPGPRRTPIAMINTDMIRHLIASILLLLAAALPAQVSGTVKDTTGAPLIGATVVLKGTTQGTNTDIDGRFFLDASQGTLVFYLIGYDTLETEIAGRMQVDVVLREIDYVLENMVVIGYGTQRKQDLTTAVSVIGEESIRNRPIVTAAEALQGKAAGVQVVQPSGKPGGEIAVRVRGATSVLAGNEPLYVVDGLPTTDIRGLNASDIASMTVLKDASSSAIYGARAA